MTTSAPHDLAIVGGGIVGMATALQLARATTARLIVLEAEPELAAHQTGHNSGVIHSGLYYKPGSLKALNCVRGRELIFRFCEEHGIPFERCGKVVVATREAELPSLAELERRGQANSLTGLRRLASAELHEIEPNVAGLAGFLVPETGIVDYRQVLAKYAELVRLSGHEIRLGVRALGCRRDGPDLLLETTAGAIRCRNLVACAGLHSDRFARQCGLAPGVQIVPFRGEYYDLRPERHHLVRGLIYPVPDPRFPFLGVHFTRRIGGGVEAGPNAVLAFSRHGYSHRDFSISDTLTLLSSPGFWRMSAKYWQTGLGEMVRSLSKRAFVASLRKLMPCIGADDLAPGGAGVRAQALLPSGRLVDDFQILEAERMIHVLNAPSPAATASLSIGETLALMAVERFGLQVRSDATS